MKTEFEFDYDMPNDLVLMVTAMITPGKPPRIYGRPEDCDPGEPIEAEITKIEIEESNGTNVEFSTDGLFIRPRLAIQAVPLNDHIVDTAIDEWEESQ